MIGDPFMKKVALSLFIIAIALLFSVAYAEMTEEGKVIFETKCSKCHPLDRALSKQKDLGSWKKTTLRMSKYSAGVITEEEAGKVAEYLAGRTETPAAPVPEKDTPNE